MNVINERWSDLSLHFLVLLDAMSEWDTPTPHSVTGGHICMVQGAVMNSLCSQSESSASDGGREIQCLCHLSPGFSSDNLQQGMGEGPRLEYHPCSKAGMNTCIDHYGMYHMITAAT